MRRVNESRALLQVINRRKGKKKPETLFERVGGKREEKRQEKTEALDNIQRGMSCEVIEKEKKRKKLHYLQKKQLNNITTLYNYCKKLRVTYIENDGYIYIYLSLIHI